MNLGLYTFLFFLVALPGIITRRFYYKGEFSKQFSPRNLPLVLLYSALIGIVIIYFSGLLYNIFITDFFEWNRLSHAKLKNLILDLFNDNKGTNLIQLLYNEAFVERAIAFTGSIIFSSFSLAQLLYNIVRRFRLDKKISFLRFSNHWYYYLRGEFLQFKNFNISYKKILWVYADVLIDTNNNGTKLYTGTVSQYEINKETNELENLYLTHTFRYKQNKNYVEESENEDESRKMCAIEIPGNCFIVPYEKVINLNLRVVYKEHSKKRIRHKIINFIISLYPLLFFILILTPFVGNASDFIENHFKYPLIAKPFFSIYASFIATVFKENLKKRKREYLKKSFSAMVIIAIMLLVIYSILYALGLVFNL